MTIAIENNQEIKSIIPRLFYKLLNIYEQEFSIKVLSYFVPKIDFIKLNLFKKVVLTLLNDQTYVRKLYKEFYKECLMIESNKFSEFIYPLLKKYWIKLLIPINNLTAQDKRKLIFYVNRWLNKVSNQSFFFGKTGFTLNILKIIKKNLLSGVKNCLKDLIKNQGYLDIKYVDSAVFKMGQIIAPTNNKIIYKNELMELIQYLPNQESNNKAPLLFITPFINKHYILDLSSTNSLVGWLLKQGIIVYVISWCNLGLKLANKTFSDYIVNGTVKAINVIINFHKIKAIHLAGYCMGGTMLSCTLSYMQKINNHNILSATHIMSPLDFSNLTDLNEDLLNELEKNIIKTGYLDSRGLCTAFNIVHINELIWPYFINYYLLKKPLTNFSSLYWNSDPVLLPATMYNFYLRTICWQNKLREANGIKINGIGVELAQVTVPICSIAGEQDPISNWRIIYDSMKLYSLSSNKQFILSTAGHINGLISSPDDDRFFYSYRINKKTIIDPKLTQSSADWLKNSIEYSGSWWPYWLKWLNYYDI